MNMSMIRIQKLLADAGLGSRRSIEEWIRAGRITVAGRVAQLGDRATANDEICLDGRRLERAGAVAGEVLLYHKPVGEVTTRSDPQGRPTVFERLPELDRGRWITVGRLDVNTSGLLLFSTDGELAHRLMHPSSEIEREYLVRVRGRPDAAVLRQLKAGVELEDGPARFDRITEDQPEVPPRVADAAEPSNASFRVVLHEGRNREVRRIWSAVGFEVSRLMRIRYGPVELPRDLRPGSSRKADSAVVERLRNAVGRVAEAGAGQKAPRVQVAPAWGGQTATPDGRRRPKLRLTTGTRRRPPGRRGPPG
jgi:23S rRNA pseudouridine2605 synthase